MKKIEEGCARAREHEEEIRKFPESEWTQLRTELLSAYERMVRQGSGDPTWTMPTFGERDLRNVVVNRCVNELRRDPVGWLEKHARDFVAFANTQPHRCGGFAPRGFAEWFNKGKPGTPPPKRRLAGPPELRGPTVEDSDRMSDEARRQLFERHGFGGTRPSR